MAFTTGLQDGAARYWDDVRPEGLAVHPGIAFALQAAAQARLGTATGSPEAWLGVVHAETDLHWYRPFAVGQAITTQGRIVARRQTRVGVCNVERYRMTDERGRLVAELDFTLMFRGSRLEGGDRTIEPPYDRPGRGPGVAGGATEEIISHHIPRSLLHHYAAGSGIHAAIHTERRAALAAGFSDVILQGSALKSSMIGLLLERRFDGDPRRARRLCGRLRTPVLADSTVELQIFATEDAGDERRIFFGVSDATGAEAIVDGLFVGHRGDPSRSAGAA